jgi:hypothetical protein
MVTTKFLESALVSGNRNISSYSNISQFMKTYLKGAIECPDLDTLSSILGIKRREAEKVVIRNKEDRGFNGI